MSSLAEQPANVFKLIILIVPLTRCMSVFAQDVEEKAKAERNSHDKFERRGEKQP